MVFQSFNLFAHKTILENVTLGPIKVLGKSKADAKASAEQLLQRVARSLAMEPKLMLFDEPTSALDPEMINEVLQVMLDLAKSGTTMMVVTHEMGFARSAADRVLFMEDGAIIEENDPESFYNDAKTDRARNFLSKIITH